MKILYHMTNLPPKMAGTEASLQELNVLRNHFGGNLVHLNPNRISPVYLPRLLFGFHLLKKIRADEAALHTHHIYNADPFPFPFVRWLKKPVIYSISSGVGKKRPNITWFNNLAAVTVSDKTSLRRLQDWGSTNCHLVQPGIDATRFEYSPLPLQSELKIMVGSAPWTRAQFQSKGMDALLVAAQQLPKLKLICLWRGVQLDEMTRRVKKMGLEQQVEIINKKVDVNQILARVHASITLVTNPAIIRSYPHTLMESLAAGKPIIVSRSIPMSAYVERTGCGQVVENITPENIISAVMTLRQNYNRLQKSALRVGQQDFSHQKLIASFQNVYERVINIVND